MKLDCGKVQEITRMYADCIDNIPDEDAKQEYLSHLEACEKCRCDSQEILRNIATLKEFSNDIPTKDGLTITQSVMKTVNALEAHKKTKFKFRYTGTAVAAVIAAVIMAGANSSLFGSLFGKSADNFEAADEAYQYVESQSVRTVPNGTILNAARDDTKEFEVYNSPSEQEFKADTDAGVENDTAQSIKFTASKEKSMAAAPAQEQRVQEEYDSDEFYVYTDEQLPESNANISFAGNTDDLLYDFLNKENARVELCVVHPDGYHTIPFEYAKVLGTEGFMRWVMSIENEEVEYTPQYFKEHFKEFFEK